METPVLRAIDELGRIVLPIEVRRKCGWDSRDTLSIFYADNNTVVLQLAEKSPGPRCVFCGATEAKRTHNKKDICGSCLDNIIK